MRFAWTFAGGVVLIMGFKGLWWATYLYALVSSYGVGKPHACYSIDFLVEEDNVGDFA